MPQQSNKDNSLETMRHSTAHLLAATVQKLWPDTKFAIGPAIENGFYYDFEFSKPISEEDISKIEKDMEKIKEENLSFERYTLPVGEAIKKEKERNQPYKVELIEDLKKSGETEVSYYKLGGFDDLCAGPHVPSTSQIGYFKLLNIAGAYWRGSEKNPMLTRIYGTVWPTKEELDKYLWQQEEAKKRDHKKIGQAMELFFFHETAPGMAYWLPKGLTVFNELVSFWRQEHIKRGYQEFSGPLINDKALWEKSGHWEYYQENMFVIPVDENTTYGVKPMNCPNAMVVFASKPRSYRDLPLRLSDVDIIHRAEPSGTLNGLLRTRKFQQDDAHIFITEDQIEGEFKEIFQIVDLFYKVFDLKYKLRLGTRPEKYMGDEKTWGLAEKTLEEILKKSGREYFVATGEGAFYGPKVDILMQDALGREWQMGTIQLDFQLPERFELKYTDKEGSSKTPAVIHRVIYGSLERFIAILLEHFAGNLPLWLSPVQVKILPITDRNINYAKMVCDDLQEAMVRVEVDAKNETLDAKIRDAQVQKVPYMVIVGDKEEGGKTISVRGRDGKTESNLRLEEFRLRIVKTTEQKALA